jgi:hypothetical protein
MPAAAAAAGGGLTPWALSGSYASEGEIGATAFATRVRSQSYALSTQGAAVTWNDRPELSFARQDFDVGHKLAPPGLPGLHLKQDTASLKPRQTGAHLPARLTF